MVGYAGLFRLEGTNPERVSLGASHARTRLTDAVVVDVRGVEVLWVASAGAGVLRVREGRFFGRLRRAQGLADDLVWDLHPHGDEVLIATASGLSVARGGRVVRHPIDTASRQLAVRDVRAVGTRGDAIIAATFGGGVYRIDGRRARRIPGSPDNSFAIGSSTSDARLLVGHTAGVAQWRSGQGPVGRFDQGRAQSLPSADVTALARAFGRIWVGTFDQGLATITTRAGHPPRVRPVTQATARWSMDPRVNDLAVTRRGGQRLWIATDRGLYWHDGRRFAPVEDPAGPGRTHVTSLHVDGQGRLWVTAARQLCRWDGRWRAWSAEDGDGSGLPLSHLHAVTTHGDEVWIGSLYGLYRFDTESGRHERHTVSSGALPVDWVNAVTTHRGQLVAGTYHGGLSWHSERSANFRHEGEDQGLPAGWVNPHAMRSIDGRLWIGTLDRGLVIGNRGAWHHFTIASGLPSNDVTDFLPDGDGVWVATRGGLVRMERSQAETGTAIARAE